MLLLKLLVYLITLYDGMHLSGFADPILNGTFKIVDIPSSKSISVEIPQKILWTPFYERD